MRLFRRKRPVLFYNEGYVDPADLKEWPGPVIPVVGDPTEHVAVALHNPRKHGAPGVQAVAEINDGELRSLLGRNAE